MTSTIKVVYQNEDHKELLDNLNQNEVNNLLEELEDGTEIGLDFILKHLSMVAMQNVIDVSRNKIMDFNSSLDDTLLFNVDEYNFEGIVYLDSNDCIIIEYKGSKDELLMLALLGSFTELDIEISEQFGNCNVIAYFNGMDIERLNF